MKKFLIIPLVLIATTACVQQMPLQQKTQLSQQQETLVYTYDDDKQLILKKGVTTKEDVGEKLGSPDTVGWAGEGIQGWIYYQRPNPYRPQTLNINFDSDNKAVSFKIIETSE